MSFENSPLSEQHPSPSRAQTTRGSHPRPSRRQSLLAGLLGVFVLAVLAVTLPGQADDGIGEVTLFGEEEFTIKAATKTECEWIGT